MHTFSPLCSRIDFTRPPNLGWEFMVLSIVNFERENGLILDKSSMLSLTSFSRSGSSKLKQFYVPSAGAFGIVVIKWLYGFKNSVSTFLLRLICFSQDRRTSGSIWDMYGSVGTASIIQPPNSGINTILLAAATGFVLNSLISSGPRFDIFILELFPSGSQTETPSWYSISSPHFSWSIGIFFPLCAWYRLTNCRSPCLL